MNSFLLMVPLFLIRFGLLRLLNKDAIRRAALFAPLIGNEKLAVVIYQLSNIFILLYPLVLKIQTETQLFIVGLVVYFIGICILTLSTIGFAKPNQNGINSNGIYRLSRNPMYLGYFFYFLGCVILTCSLVLCMALFIFQISTHWIILSEERWCINKFGDEYIRYMEKVRRYI